MRGILLRGVPLAVIAALLLVGCQSAAPTPTPAPAVNLFLQADTVQGPANLTDEEIVWRTRVIDPTVAAQGALDA